MRRQQIIKDEADTLFNNQQQLIGTFGDFFGELSGVIADGAGEQNAAYQALFAVQKGFVLASAALSLQKALAEANALPFPANLPAYAQAMSAGTQIISAIRGIAFGGGRYNGGAVGAGNLYRVGEHGKPEIFKANNGSQYMIPGDNGRVISNRDIGGGGGVTINSPITINTTNGFSDEDSRRR
ncbi:putative gp21 protein [Escherichia coli 1-250-04_S3_C2]|nr:putative gp21 protein [Escherichia coli 1-250-04_S3_C2]